MFKTYWGFQRGELQSKHKQSALGRQSMSGVLVLLTDVFSKCMKWLLFHLKLCIPCTVYFNAVCVAPKPVKFVFMIIVHFQVLQISSVPSRVPPGAFPDGLHNSYQSPKWHGCQVCARSQGKHEWGLGTSRSSRSNFWRSPQCSWTNWTNRAFFILKNAKSAKGVPMFGNLDNVKLFARDNAQQSQAKYL